MRKLLLLVLASVFRSSLLQNRDSVVFPCETPDGEHAYCLSLFDCPHLMKSLATLQPQAIDYFMKSMCLGCEVGAYMICCGSPFKTPGTQITSIASNPVYPVPVLPANTLNTPPKIDTSTEARRNYAKNNLIPSQKFCGQQHTDDRVYTGNETALDEFPWITHHYLTADRDVHTGWCTGVLISSRYVLTDAYCAAKTYRIRLGQYSTHKNSTCVEEYNVRECSDPLVVRQIEKLTRSGKQAIGPYDLTLLRLNQAVVFSEYIRPICLPVDGSKRPASQSSLIFSGWGSASDLDVEVLKQRLTYNLQNSDICYNADASLKYNIKLAGVSFFCLTPPSGNSRYACLCEHGGPVMYKHKHRWFADGIIVEVLGTHKGHRCSSSNPVGGIYIDRNIMNWILDNMED